MNNEIYDKTGTLHKEIEAKRNEILTLRAPWHLFDLFPNRANGWNPKISYAASGK